MLKTLLPAVAIAFCLTGTSSLQAHPPGHAYGWCKNHGGCGTPTNTHIGSTITSGHAPTALPKPTPIIAVPPLPVMAVPKPVQFAVPKPVQVVVPPLKPGFVDHPNYQGLRDPHTGYPMPTLPVARYPLPKPVVVPPVVAGNIPPQMKPGFAQFPNYTGPRNPANGYPIPPQAPTLTPNPQPGQVPAKVPPVVAGNVPPQMKPGFAQFPNYTGPRNPANGYPIPPQAPTLAPNPQPGRTPTKVPPVVAGNVPPQMKPGFAQFPNYTGPRNPANGYPIPPQAPTLAPNPQPGRTPAKVPPVVAGNIPPQMKPGFAQFPNYTGPRNPANGYPIPPQAPTLTPNPQPGQVPAKVPPVVAGNIPPQMKPGFAQFPNYTGPRNPANGYPIPPQAPTLAPNPQPGQVPAKVPPVVAGNIPPQMKPGFAQFPNYTGPRNPANGYPIPLQAPTLAPNPQPGRTPAKVPPVVAGNIPPQMKPGFAQFPNYTGPRNPANGYPIPPQAPTLTPNPQPGQVPAKVPPVVAGNVPPQMKPGFAQFPNYTGPRNPANGYPIPPQAPTLAPNPQPGRTPAKVPPVVAGNIPPQMKPGFAQFPNYTGPRNPANGYPIPPQAPTLTPNPQPGQVPAKVPPVVAGNIPPQMKPGFAQFPNYTGPRNPANGYPIPPQAPTLAPNPQPGQVPAKVPPVVAGNIPPQMKPGFAQFPNYTGPRNPANGYPIPLQAPTLAPNPQPGRTPAKVPPVVAGNIPPQMKPGFAQFPNYTGPRNPANGYPVPVSSGSADGEKAARQVRIPRDEPEVADYGLDFRVIGIALPRF